MNLFYISAEQDFLLELTKGISVRFADIELSKITILLPTRRSCQKLTELLIEQKNGSIMLPKILPMGDVEEDEILPSDFIDDFDLTIPQSFNQTDQLLLLSTLFNKLSSVKAIDIAQGLSKLLARLHRDEIDLSKLNYISFGDVPEHVNNLIEYLHVLASKWPDLAKKHNKIDFIQRRNLQLSKRIESWNDHALVYPVIAAGSSGSVKSTSRLLKALAQLPNGYVVLRGVDPSDGEDGLQNIDYYHPLFYLQSFMKEAGVDFNSLKSWSDTYYHTSRNKLLKEAMRSVCTVDQWSELSSAQFHDLNNLTIIDCQSQHEEAAVIALKLREILLTTKTVAVISNDTDLLIKLRSLMEIWDIKLNDSHGVLLTYTPQIAFLKLIIDVVYDFSPLNLLALLKHQYFCLNRNKSELLDIVYKLEIDYLRGICSFISLEELMNLVKDKSILEVLRDLEKIIKPLKSLTIFSQMLHSHIVIAEQLSSIQALWGDNSGGAVSKALNEILNSSKILRESNSQDYWSILSKLLQGKKYYTYQNSVIDILSPMESRLLHFDVVILAGLNEGVWPGNIAVDPWFNSGIANELGLVPDEYKIGLAAHDFYCLAHMPEILLTRSNKIGGSPTTPSRWLVRLEALLKKIDKLDQVKPQKHKLQYWAEQLFLPKEYNDYIPEAPKPPFELRSKELSVTQVEKLMRDPYSFYAAKILKLKPLDPIDKDPDQRDFGNFIHSVIDEFNKLFVGLSPDQYLSTLLSLAQKNIKHISTRPIIQRIWLPRFAEIAKWLVEFEIIRRKSPTNKIHSEIKGKFIFDTKYGPVAITAKADRIESDNGLVSIMDFKTGIVPTSIDILTGHSPQLTLEALIAEQGGFTDLDVGQRLIVEELIYAQLASGSKLGNLSIIKHDISKLIQAANSGVKQLVEIYLDENTAYIICPSYKHRPSYNEYEHLERIDEWL
jgi:ATP-dependent helicase/nuclease subunit B